MELAYNLNSTEEFFPSRYIFESLVFPTNASYLGVGRGVGRGDRVHPFSYEISNYFKRILSQINSI